MEISDILATYAKKFNKTIEELEQLYNEESSKCTITEEGKKRRLVLTKITNRLKREAGITSATKEYIGIALGITDLVDQIEVLRRIAEKEDSLDHEKAVREGYVDEEHVPLDRRERIMGMENPNKGLPLQGHDYRRTVIGLCTPVESNEEDWKLFSLRYYGKNAENLNVPLNKFCTFRAIPKSEEGKSRVLNASEIATRFIECNIDRDVSEILRKLDLVVSLDKVDDWYQMYQEASTPKPFLIIEGGVYRKRPSTRSNRTTLILSEIEYPDILIRCSVPEYIPLNFGEDSRVIVIGKPRMWKNALWINAVGVYPLPDYIVPE